MLPSPDAHFPVIFSEFAFIDPRGGGGYRPGVTISILTDTLKQRQRNRDQKLRSPLRRDPVNSGVPDDGEVST